MKVFFTLLLVSNIVFAVFQWLLPYEQLLPRAHKAELEVAEKLMILDESETSSTQDQKSTSKAASVPDPAISGPLCYTLGPFKEQQLAQETASQFRKHQISITSRSSVEKEYMGMMVYIDGHSTRKQAIATADSLKQQGVRDYIIVNEEGRPNLLSLGVFGLKKNAEGRQSRIAALGYEVKTEPRYRNRTIYWLDYSQPENDGLAEVIQQLKNEQGISRISRQCS